MRYWILSLSFLIVNIVYTQNDTISYFQQEVNFDISVELNDSKHQLIATEKIQYINHSKDSLDSLVFHVWPNAYKNLETGYAKEKIEQKDKDYFLNHSIYKGGIDSILFLSNEKKLRFKYHPEHEDIIIVYLPTVLKPKSSINLSCFFIVDIPFSFSRLGRAEYSYQISQWYPKPAVYDKNGWNAFPYRDIGEFYSEFGKYKVKIKAPKTYKVAATGNLTHKSSSDSFIEYTFEEEQIHDFAWVADKKFIIDKDSVQLPYSSKWVTVESYYKPQSLQWQKANQYIKDAIYFYSLWLGDYPYKTCKAIESELGAGGGMEYPTLTIIGSYPDISSLDLETVIMHEVGHNWFYGILASNERKYPFLDEGLNSAYEARYLESKYPNKILNTELNFKSLATPIYKNDYYSYLLAASRNIDQAGNLSSEQYNMLNYGTIIYKKNAALFNYLRHYWGDEYFDQIMKLYYSKWKFKHPQAEDLKTILRFDGTENLKWFFELLETRKKMDYKICSIKNRDEHFELKIRNTKDIESPVFIEAYQKDSLIQKIKSKGFKSSKTFLINKNADQVYLDRNFRSLDYNRNNNFIKTKGFIKKTKGLNLKLFGDQVKEDKTQFFFSPAIGYNTTNHFMFGLAFHNNLAFPKQFEYLIMPMYALGNETIAGESKFEYHIQTNNDNIQEITPYLYTKSYGLNDERNYYQAQAGMQINFLNFNNSQQFHHELKLYYLLASQYFSPDKLSHFINLDYTLDNNRWFNPYYINFKINTNRDFALASLDLKQTLSYSKPNTGLKFRFFIGAFLFNNSNNGLYNLSLDGTYGIKDFDFQNTFVGRNESYNHFWAHQFIANEGGFTHYAPYSSNNWMSSLTISSGLPIRSPFELYFSIAAFENSNQYFENGLAWELGLSFTLIRDFAILYFPITAHKKILETNNLVTESSFEKIRFTLRLNQWNLKKLSRNINKLIN